MTNKNKPLVEEVAFDNLDDILGTSATAVITPEEEKNTVLKNPNVDTSFIDNVEEEEEEEEKETTNEEENSNEADTSFLDEEFEEEEDEEIETRGRKKQTKDIAISAVSNLIKKGLIQPFVNENGELEKPLEEYTQQDIEELIEANIQDGIQKVAQDAPLRVFSTLPEEVQHVVNYALNGGQDTKAVFKILSQTQEVYELSLDNEDDQEKIVRQWMHSQDWGTSEEIENEIQDLKDSNKLKAKAEVFKPKLDAKQAQVVQAKLAAQAKAQEQAMLAAKTYAEDVYHTLKKGELNGIPLNDKIQNMLYFGLTDKSRYNDRNGNPTNELGYLLEQYQYGDKKNLDVINEVLWLMKDPAGYKKEVMNKAVNENNKKTARVLRTAEQQAINPSSSAMSQKQTSSTQPRQTIKKQNRNIFSRS